MKNDALQCADSFGERLKAARERKGIYQNRLAKQLELTSGRIISNWENGIARPDIENMVKLCRALDISAAYLLGYFGGGERESELITSFGMLDGYGQKLVLSVVELEKRRVLESAAKREEKPRFEAREIMFFDCAASAGTGQFLDGAVGETVFVPLSAATEKADFVLPVAGDSMEPDFSDGDLVCVKSCESLGAGDIGIILLNGEAYIKRYEKKRLVSLNPKYKDIIIKESDSVFCRGLVLGKTELV